MKAFLSFLLLSIATSAGAQNSTSGADRSVTRDTVRALPATEIRSVEAVSVQTPAGCAPRLPYRLWVTYADGRKEYRQVRWQNATLDAEQAQAALPAGTEYIVEGFLTGDNTTAQGFPVSAQVSVTATAAAAPAATPVAQPLPLNQVQLTGHNRLTENRDLDIDQLLSLDVAQQLYNYRDTYGLPTEDYPVADGWDSPTTKLKGHGSGHYMSALALAYASCIDARKRSLLKANAQRMVDELRACQERTFTYDKTLGRYLEARDLAPEEELLQLKGTWADFDRYKQDYSRYGYGYLNAIPAQHCVLVEAYRAYNNEQWVWAPYYSVHKQLAGLIDIATYIPDRTLARKALLIARDMGLWVWNRLHYRTYVQSGGTQSQRRARPGNRYEMWNMYIAGEVGGMAESLSRLAQMVADSTSRARLLEAATYFDSPAFFKPLAHNIDAIRTRHANQHIPMVTGALSTFRAGGSSDYYHVAENFWTLVQGRYRYAMGGVGNGEMFRQPYTQMLAMCTFAEPTMNETCCAYNLAKLTRDLNAYHPNDARYMDYYERVLYNQIIGSLRPGRYAVTYQYAVGRDASKPWGNETPQSTCCGGTGAENHVRYQEATYFVGGDTLWVALYLPTTAQWTAQKVTIQQDCEWPAERSVLHFPRARKPFVLKLRVPYWATQGFDISVNGHSIATRYQPGSYVTLPLRRWRPEDRIEITMPYVAHTDFGPDIVDGCWYGAQMQGPLVMCTDAAGNSLPDYAADSHITHYHPFAAAQTDTTNLAAALQQALQRQRQQETWMALDVKVPEYAPWAPHGYARMLQQARSRDPQLSATLSAMRPGNLAEPEDLAALQQLLDTARQRLRAQGANPTPQQQEAIDYANMVIKYVTGGSGTRDMIEKAEKRMRALQ